MKKLLPVFILLTACNKELSLQQQTSQLSNSNTLSYSTLIVKGSLDLQSPNANIASLSITNYRSSYELCGTAGTDLLWPVVLPLSDSSVYPLSILAEGDSLTAGVYLDTMYVPHYIIDMVVEENNNIVIDTIVKHRSMAKNFVFHSGSKYHVSATVENQ